MFVLFAIHVLMLKAITIFYFKLNILFMTYRNVSLLHKFMLLFLNQMKINKYILVNVYDFTFKTY